MNSNPFEEQKEIAQARIDVCEGGLIGMITGLALLFIGMIVAAIFL